MARNRLPTGKIRSSKRGFICMLFATVVDKKAASSFDKVNNLLKTLKGDCRTPFTSAKTPVLFDKIVRNVVSAMNDNTP